MSEFRNYLHNLWKTLSSIEGIERLNIDAAFREELTDQYHKYQEEWSVIQNQLASKQLLRAGKALIAFLTGGIGFQVALGGLAGFQLGDVFNSVQRRKKHEQLPLGIFLRLERAS